jgi:pimeloyl-ACP methyl ester carboxylesterase
MNSRTLRIILKYVIATLTILTLVRYATAQQPSPGVSLGGGRTIPRVRPDSGPKPKTIRGTVQYSDGKGIDGAHVLVRDVKTNVTRTLTTNVEGIYNGAGFPSNADYEITAEYQGQVSEKKSVSAFLDREDNVLNFQMKVASAAPGGAASRDTAKPAGLRIDTFDLVKLAAVLDLPSGVPAPIPAVMLLHGFGEDRTVWNAFKMELLGKGYAVMTIDLRGHGESTVQNNRTITANKEWRSSPQEFPVDVDAALTWLKTQTRINSSRIAVIGSDVGASLALIASGKYREVRTVIAVNPNLREAQEMAGSAQDYHPRSALILARSEAEGAALKEGVRSPLIMQVVNPAGGTSTVFQNPQVTDPIFKWLKDNL